jgi:hypothetical protein
MPLSFRSFGLACALVVACAFTALFPSCVAAQTMGLHVASVHLPAGDGMNNANPGLYARWHNGATVGAYYNSLRRVSLYAGWTIEQGPFALTVGLVSGYQKKREARECSPSEREAFGASVWCWTESGNTSGAVGPLLAPSVRLPVVLGITPRLTVLPKISAKGHTVLHLSMEKAF